MNNSLEEYEKRLAQNQPVTRDDFRMIQNQEREDEWIAKEREKQKQWMKEHRDKILSFLPEWERKLQAEKAINILAGKIGRHNYVTRTLQASTIFSSISDNEIEYKILVKRFTGAVPDIQPTGKMLVVEDQINERASRAHEYEETAMVGTKQAELEDAIKITLTQKVDGLSSMERRWRSKDYISQELLLGVNFIAYLPEDRVYKKKNFLLPLSSTAQIYEKHYLYNEFRESLCEPDAQRIFLSHMEGLYKAWKKDYKK